MRVINFVSLALAILPLAIGLPAQAQPWQRTLQAAQHYQSPAGDGTVAVTIVPLGGSRKNEVLLRFSGVDHPLQQQVWIYRVHTQSAPYKKNYYLVGTQKSYFQGRGLQTLYKGSLQEYFEVLADHQGHKVIYAKAASQAIDSAQLWQQYWQQQGIDRSLGEDQAALSQKLQASYKDFTQACHPAQPPPLQVAWQRFAQAKQLPVVLLAGNYLRALQTLCLQDQDYQAVIATITLISVSLAAHAEQHQLRYQKNQLSIGIAAEMPNTRLMARQWLEVNL